MRVKFIGNPRSGDTGKVCEMFGKTFFLDHEVDVSDLADSQRQKIAGNDHFEVVTSEEPKRRGPGRPRKEVPPDGENEAAA